MAKGKLSPRQKMINLMYLVFIAMMAMNVDREVLRSFESINTTLTQSSQLTNENNTTFYDQITAKAGNDPEYKAIEDKANLVKLESNKVYSTIESIKQALMKEGEYTLPLPGSGEETNYSSLSNTDAINKLFFLNDKPTEQANGLKSAIDGFRSFLGTAYESSKRDKDRVDLLFSTDKKGNETWLMDKFNGQPMVAALANLTKIQSDVRTEEGNLVRTLLANKLQDEIELKAFQPIVVVPPFMRKGDVKQGNIAFGAFDNTLQGTVTVNGRTIPLNGGKASFALDTGTPGKRTVSGTMSYKAADGSTKTEKFSETYEVVSETIVKPPSGGVITADKMNVVYRGLDNPISATVNGADGPVSLSASVGGLSGSNGKYNFRPSAGSGTVKFTVSAKTSSGKTISDTKEFRIKPVPPARGVIAGKTSIAVPANGIAAQTVRVDWPDFLFDIKADVVSFKVKVAGQPTAVLTGNKMSGAAGAISKARKGDAIFVFDIKYRSSTGITGEASPITIEVR